MSDKKEGSNPEDQCPFSRNWIKLNLGLKGFTIRSFAKQHGVKAGTVAIVFSRPYPRMERLIADTIGIPPELIWPERYDQNGKPNRPNLWHRRRYGEWIPKYIKEGSEVNQKVLDGKNEGTD